MQRPISVMNYSAVRQFGQFGGSGVTAYVGPSSGISRLAATVTAQGSMLSLAAPYANCSYSLEFYGPSIACGPASSTNATRIAKFIDAPGTENPYTFVSFVPLNNSGEYSGSDVALVGLNETLNNQGYSVATYDSVSLDHGRIYVTVYDGPSGIGSANKTIECGLYNTSYDVNFTFSNEQPNLTITNATRLNGVASNLALARCGNNETINNEAGVCSPEGVAYFALLDAFGQQLIGYLVSSHYGGSVSPILTQVSKTAFMDSKELYGAQYYMDNGETTEVPPTDAVGLTQALEDAFTNAALSLLSSTSFLCVSHTYADFPQI